VLFRSTEGKRPFGIGFFQWYSKRLLQAAGDNPLLALSFYQVMHMLKPPMILFSPRVLAAVLFWKRPVQLMQDEHRALPDQPGDVRERAEVGEPV